MNIHSQKNNLDILKQTQENLDATQKNTELLTAVLQQLLGNETPSGRKPKTDEEKLKAAYALNLCTVSVSQIVDYNDLAFLEHEYDAILNNLNLEEMPKDEALLRILKQLLDVITFFRIQEGDKKMLDREYQQRMKDAIWSAVPNVGVIVGTNAISTAISLASQVGIGYMNYRKEKSKASLDRENSEWQLQRSAMEQFNGLRRELFDTAWRLADEYNFPDEFRITERQITQYNKILMDPDPLRRYERLEYIAGRFKAYPPYWYYRGNAANAVFQDSRYPDEVRNEYKQNAVKDFSRFLEDTEKNLLREDQLVAACALECFDLVEDKDLKRKLLHRAKAAAGNAYDVLQLCALSELKIGKTKNAAELLRMLVNEGYNTEVNAQLLSSIYVTDALCSANFDDGVARDSLWKTATANYKTLKDRVGDIVLVPMPEQIPQNTEVASALAKEFISCRKTNLQYKCAYVLWAVINKYEGKFDEICHQAGDVTEPIIALIDDMCSTIIELELDERDFLDEIQAVLNDGNKGYCLKEFFEDEEMRQGKDNKPQFETLTSAAFTVVAKQLIAKLQNMDMIEKISETDSAFDRVYVRYADEDQEKTGSSYIIRSSLLGKNHEEKTAHRDMKNACLNILKTYGEEKIIHDSKKKGQVRFLRRGEDDFLSYFKENHAIRGNHGLYLTKEVIAVLDDKRFNALDLHFSLLGIHVIGAGIWKKEIFFAPYRLISVGKGSEIKLGNRVYKNDHLNRAAFLELTKVLAEKIGQYDVSVVENSLANQIREKVEQAEI